MQVMKFILSYQALKRFTLLKSKAATKFDATVQDSHGYIKNAIDRQGILDSHGQQTGEFAKKKKHLQTLGQLRMTDAL